MRRMSFSMTTPQFLDGSKTVTRRLGWTFAEPGDLVMGIEKGMGLKKGEKQVELGAIVLVDVRRERLDAISAEDCAREGFPEMTPAEFVAMFCKAGRCKPSTIVTRIEFRHAGSPRSP